MSCIFTIKRQTMAARHRRILKRTLRVAVVMAIGFVGLTWANNNIRLAFNQTRSLPERVFLVMLKETPVRGDYAMFRIFDAASSSTGDAVYFIKQVSGVGGDIISHDHGNVLINGQVIGYAKPVSLEGKPLAITPPGIIPPGHYFLTSPHQNSYDSRYQNIGLVGRDRIVGRAYPLF